MTLTSRPKTNKALKATIENLYNHWFDRVPVNIMKLSEISKALEVIYKADDSEENRQAQYAMLVEKYRVDTKGVK